MVQDQLINSCKRKFKSVNEERVKYRKRKKGRDGEKEKENSFFNNIEIPSFFIVCTFN